MADMLPVEPSVPRTSQAEERLPAAPASTRAVTEAHTWVEMSEEERAERQAREARAADDRRLECEAFEQMLQEVQRDILDGSFEAVHTRLSPLLGAGTEETVLDRLIERIGYEMLGDALFFFSTASGYLATSDGEASFASLEHQQLIVDAFAVCKRLLERFREKRAEASLLLRSLLSRVYTLYLRCLMDLAMSQMFEEFGEGEFVGRAFTKLSQMRAASSASSAAVPCVLDCMPGDLVQIVGLQSKPELNGQAAEVLNYNAARKRYEVRVEGASVPMLFKRENLVLPDSIVAEWQDEDAKTDTPLLGNLSTDLDRINASIRSGFNFITALSRAEKQLVMISAHELGPMHQGLQAISRANIVHYERGHLLEAVQTFESMLLVIEQQQSYLSIEDGLVPAAWREQMSADCGATSLALPTATLLRSLAEACIKMHPAHEHAARMLSWSRAIGFESKGASKPMQAGWACVLEQAKVRSAATKVLKWKPLCEFMRFYFDGLRYITAHRDALCTGTAARFVVDNLRDPVYMILHQCKQLEASSELLRHATEACQASLCAGQSLPLGVDPVDPDSPVYDGLDGQSMQTVRQQLVTALRWLVELHGMYHRLDGIVRYSIRGDPEGTCSHRFHGYHTALAYVNSLLQSFTVRYYRRSTLLDLFHKTMKHSRFLDFFLYRDLCGEEIKSLQMHATPERQNGQMVIELKDDLPGYLKWFMTSRERNSLAVRFGVMCQLMGFDLKAPAIAENMQWMRDGTHSGRFCVYAVEIIELLRQMGAQSMPSEIIAEFVVSAGRSSAISVLLPGVDSSDRRARRSPEVLKISRRICQLVESVRARFPTADLVALCDKRQLHVRALEVLFERMVASLRMAAPAAGMAGSGTAEGFTAMDIGTIDRLGKLMPTFTPQDMHDLNLHAIALAELASDINLRMQAVFGGNFPALVWLNDCYEFDPANKRKDTHLIGNNEHILILAVLVIQAMLKEGHVTSQPAAAATSTVAVGGAEAVRLTTPSTPRDPAAASQSGKKKKDKR